jgi:hypothetical protein
LTEPPLELTSSIGKLRGRRVDEIAIGLSGRGNSSANLIKLYSKSARTIALSMIGSNLQFDEIRAKILSRAAQTELKKSSFLKGRLVKIISDESKLRSWKREPCLAAYFSAFSNTPSRFGRSSTKADFATFLFADPERPPSFTFFCPLLDLQGRSKFSGLPRQIILSYLATGRRRRSCLGQQSALS